MRVSKVNESMKKIFILLLIIILVLSLYNDQIRLKVRRVIDSTIQKTVVIVKSFISKETTKGKEKLSQKKEETTKKVKDKTLTNSEIKR